MPQPTCTISVLAWPAGMDREGAAGVLVEALGMDPFIAGQRVAKPPPLVVARVPPEVARSVRDVLRQHQVSTLVISDSDIARLPQPTIAKRLEAALGAPEPMYLVEPWRGETCGLRMSEVYCIVRGRVRKLRVKPGQPDFTDIQMSSGSYGYDTLGSGGWEEETIGVRAQKTAHISQIIDLWVRGAGPVPGRVRINADKFNWDVLGKQRALSDLESSERLALRLAEQAPRAAVELGFTEFCDASGPLIGLARTTSPGGTMRTDENPAFEFYSVWCALRHWKQGAS